MKDSTRTRTYDGAIPSNLGEEKEIFQEILLAYMEWWSEKAFCAGWLIDLPDAMAESPDNRAFQVLVASAGGWYIHGKEERIFIPGTYQELIDRGSREK